MIAWLDLLRHRRNRRIAVQAAARVFQGRPDDPPMNALMLAIVMETYLNDGGDAVARDIGLLPPDGAKTTDNLVLLSHARLGIRE